MKTKFLLPVLAMIFAIGMSFTTVKSDVPANDYVHLGNNSWRAISEQNCNPGPETCRVQFGVGGPIYDVYDEMDLATLKDSDSPEPTVINP